MAGLRPDRVVVSMVLAALLLTVSPWAQGGHTLASADTTTLTMTVLTTGVLTVSTATSTVSWNYPDAADLGILSFTNTLNTTTGWSVSVAMTDLVPSTAPGTCILSSTDCLSFNNVQLTASTAFTGISSGASIINMAHGPGGAFIGSDATPGSTMSTPKMVVMADGTNKGSYTQGDGQGIGLLHDSSIAPSTGLLLQPGSYSGTLQYTISD